MKRSIINMRKYLESNGYELVRIKGSHWIYSNGKHIIPLSHHASKGMLCVIKREVQKGRV